MSCDQSVQPAQINRYKPKCSSCGVTIGFEFLADIDYSGTGRYDDTGLMKVEKTDYLQEIKLRIYPDGIRKLAFPSFRQRWLALLANSSSLQHIRYQTYHMRLYSVLSDVNNKKYINDLNSNVFTHNVLTSGLSSCAIASLKSNLENYLKRSAKCRPADYYKYSDSDSDRCWYSPRFHRESCSCSGKPNL